MATAATPVGLGGSVPAPQASSSAVADDQTPANPLSTWKVFTRVRAARQPYTWHRTATAAVIGAGPAINEVPDSVTDATSARAWLARVTEQCIERMGLEREPVKVALRAVLTPTVLTQRTIKDRNVGYIHSSVLGALRDAFTGYTIDAIQRGQVRAAVQLDANQVYHRAIRAVRSC